MRTIVAAALGLLVAFAAAAHQYQAGDILIVHPHARPSLKGVANGAAFMTLENKGGAPDRLVAAETPVAAAAELHTHVDEKGVMRMRRVDAVAIPPGEKVALAPGGLHVMLVNLKRPLAPGDRFPMTLTFEKAGRVAVEVSVDQPESGHGTGHMGGNMHGVH